MSRRKKPKQPVTDYFGSVHYGVCQGELDAITRVEINEKTAWSGFITKQDSRVIDNQSLFGGVRKEGGVYGTMDVQMGSATQKSSAVLAGKTGGTPNTVPGYRGIATVLFTGAKRVQESGDSDGGGFFGGLFGRVIGLTNRSSSEGGRDTKEGFYWSSNQPYIWPVKLTVSREPKGWRPYEAGIPRGGVGNANIVVLIDKRLPESYFNAAVQSAKELLKSAEAEYSRGRTVAFSVRAIGSAVVTDETDSLNDTSKARIEAFLDGLDRSGSGSQANFEAALTWAANRASVGSFDQRVIIPIYAPGSSRDATGQGSKIPADAKSLPVVYFGSSTDPHGAAELVSLPATTIKEPFIVSSPSRIAFAAKMAASKATAVDANPAHMIVECMTHPEWGAGTSLAALDEPSLIAASQTFIHENFGLSMIWRAQSSIEKFVKEILNHVNATLFTDPATGKMRLLLIRDDYTVADLPVYNDDNSYTDRYSKRTPSEATNQLSVKWTNPKNGKEETITAQDLGAVVANNGEVVEDSRNYYGVASAELANQLLSRDLSTVAAPLSSVKLRINREAWDAVPGGLFRYSSEDHEVLEEVMRINEIDYGKHGDSEIIISATQDIFGFAKPQLVPAPETESTSGGQPPGPLTAKFVTMNYYMLANFDDTQDLVTEYPEGVVAVFSTTDNQGSTEYELFGEESNATGAQDFDSFGVRSYLSTGELVDALVPEVYTDISAFNNLTVGRGPAVGGLAIIGDVSDETTQEMVVFKSFDNNVWEVLRGALDTTPKAWPAGTPIQFFTAADSIVDYTVRSDGETARYHLSMIASDGQYEPIGDAPLSYEVTERPHLPLRPGNVAINGNEFPSAPLDFRSVTNMTVSWSGRNRTMEDSQVLDWDDPAVTPETGQTTSILIKNPFTGAVVNRIDGLTGGSYLLQKTEFGLLGQADVQVISNRDGLDSLQGHQIRVLVGDGYGYNYGDSYGE